MLDQEKGAFKRFREAIIISYNYFTDKDKMTATKK